MNKKLKECALTARVKSLEDQIERLIDHANTLDAQNKVQAHQINWCAEIIFAFSEVIKRW